MGGKRGKPSLSVLRGWQRLTESSPLPQETLAEAVVNPLILGRLVRHAERSI